MNQKKLTPEQAFHDKRAQVLSATDFPHELSEDFKNMFHGCLRHTSIIKSGLGDKIFERFIKFETPFRMAEMSVILKIMLASTAAEWGCDLNHYWQMIEKVVFPVREQFRAIDDEISDQIQKEINIKLKIITPENKTIYRV